MKNIFKSILAAAALVSGLAACTKEIAAPEEPVIPAEEQLVEVTLGAGIGLDTKTSMAENGDIKWSEGNQISVSVNGGAARTFTVSSGAGTTQATFTGAVTPAEATLLTNKSFETLTATYPASGVVDQTYVEGTFADNTLPMLGSDSDKDGNITFTATAAVVMAEGVDKDATSAKLEYTVSNESKSVTIALTAGETAKNVIFVVAPGAKDFKLKVGEEDAVEYAASKDVLAGCRYKLTPKVEGVARIGNKGYATLAEAIDAAKDGQTIVILSDITATGWVAISKDNVDFTIDLNGKTIERTNGSIFDIYSKVTFKDSSTKGTGTIKAKGRALYGNAGADFTLESGNIIGTDGSAINVIGAYGTGACKFTMNGGSVNCSGEQAIYISANDYACEFVMNGGTITSEKDYAIAAWCNNNDESVKITITGGTIYAGGNEAAITVNGSKLSSVVNISGGTIQATNGAAIYYPNKGTLTISGGTFEGTEGIVVKSGTVEITGGKFTAKGAASDPTTAAESGYTKTGDAIYVEDNYYSSDYSWKHTTVLNISGGEFKSTNGHALAARFGATGKTAAAISITGGKFASAEGKEVIAKGNNFDGTITTSGYLFSAAPANDYLKNGYQVVDNTDTETMTVYPKKVVANASSTVATTAELQAALDAATENAIIECASGTYDMVYFRQTLNNSTRRSDLDKDGSYPAYYRKFESITIKAAEGATVTCKGIKAEAGLFWYSSAPASNQAGMNKATGGFVSYLALENITIDGITFDASANSSIILRDNGAVSTRSNIMVDGLTIQNCTATGDATNNNIHFFSAGAGTNDQNFPGTEKKAFNNITIKGNSLTSFVQPICFNNNTAVVNSMAITGNTFTNCEDNQLQVSNKVNAGTWTISGNAFVGLNGRLIRMTNAQATATIRFENNVITTPRGYDTGGDGSIVKITGVNGFAVIENNNGWAAGAYTSEAKTTWISNGTMVAQIGDTKYPTLAAALIAAESGQTIEILDGTWGAEAIGKLDPAGSYTNANIVRYKSLTIKPATGATATFTSNVSLGYDDSSTANATMTVKGLTFSGASLMLSNYVQNTVEDCTFTNGTSSTAGVLIVQDACCKNHKTTGDYPASQITIKNCSIDGSNDGASGMRLRNSGNVTIEGCTIKNSKFNGILFESNGSADNNASKTISIKNNTITEWNSTNTSGQGRAMRLALGTLASGSTVTVSGNTMHKEALGLDTPDFLKATGCGSASVDISGNYWSNKTLSEVKDKSDVYTSDVTATITSVITTK